MKYRDHNIPWVTRSISKLISAKSYFFKLFKLGLVTEEENNKFRNEVQSIILKSKLSYYRAFHLAVHSAFAFANSNCYWLKQITWFILANYSCCLQKKQMKIELQVDRLCYRKLFKLNKSHIRKTWDIVGTKILMKKKIFGIIEKFLTAWKFPKYLTIILME